ncbi:MAG: glycosyltransferase family 2 protein [Bacteroidaceae bacterium]|nr:glycosyltransferase family 2 protein [Bacteroidaceae bacterium]
MPISVVIHTYNAQKYLGQVLETVRDFDEVLVCDMESTDDTLDIARTHGARIITFPKRNYTVPEPARDFAIHSVSNRWVLTVDADEFVTPELKDFLYRFIENPTHDALYVPRRNMFLGQFIKASYPDYQLRFFDQTKATWPPTIHSVPQIDGTVGYVPKDYQYAFVHAGISVSGQIIKMNDYTENDLNKRSRRKVNLLELFVLPLYRFIHYYFMGGAFLDGIPGFIKASFSASTKFFYLAKVYERQVMGLDKKEEPLS